MLKYASLSELEILAYNIHWHGSDFALFFIWRGVMNVEAMKSQEVYKNDFYSIFNNPSPIVGLLYMSSQSLNLN